MAHRDSHLLHLGKAQDRSGSPRQAFTRGIASSKCGTIKNTRKDFHFKVAHTLCVAGDMVFMEDLDYRTSAKGMLGKHMLDAGFGQFRTIVKYVCWKRGKFFGEVDARGTSQECPECGVEVRKDLSIRVHHCPPQWVQN
ncbi:RNA-guided endonuclease InsQ/TnpB family protein [Scytonema sp. PCC 10023]|uniref:RNA-guided endonuclease InsQ/TnpB family protein n=1 Tax=Scytonema sp. PCC 10023 TaxID=1680591 RepID=UPI0039C6B474